VGGVLPLAARWFSAPLKRTNLVFKENLKLAQLFQHARWPAPASASSTQPNSFRRFWKLRSRSLS